MSKTIVFTILKHLANKAVEVSISNIRIIDDDDDEMISNLNNKHNILA